MIKNVIKGVIFCVFSVVSIQNVYADDHEFPFVSGMYWEVTGIKLTDGGGLKYANWLATEWRKNMDYAVSQGWLTRHEILSNVHPRADEPDLYLIRVFNSLPDAAEDEKRRKNYMAWVKKSMEKMQEESGNRAEYRTVMSTSLLQEMKFRK